MPLAALTIGDVARIGAATGLRAWRFAVRRRLAAEEREALVDEDPLLAGLVDRRGTLVSLAVRAGACVFHAPAGCSLPLPAKPLLCRRFPFVRVRGRVRVQPGGDCLACDEAADLPDLLALFGTSPVALARLDRRVRAESVGVQDLRVRIRCVSRGRSRRAPESRKTRWLRGLRA